MEFLEIDFTYHGNVYTAVVLTDGDCVKVAKVFDDCGGRYRFEVDEMMMDVIASLSVQAWMSLQSPFYSEELH